MAGSGQTQSLLGELESGEPEMGGQSGEGAGQEATICAYEPPWHALAGYVHQQAAGERAQLGQPRSPAPLNPASPRYQLLMSQVSC